MRTVQELLGHASVTTTQIYTHVSPENLIETYLTSHPSAQDSMRWYVLPRLLDGDDARGSHGNMRRDVVSGACDFPDVW